MTKSNFPGITIWRSRNKICIRLRRETKFDRALTVKGLAWDNPEDHKKVQEIIDNAIKETEWIPYSDVAMKNLYHHLYQQYGKHKHLQKEYEHIKNINAYDCFNRKLTTKIESTKEIPKDDTVLTELRLIRNYLEELTLLQKVKQ